MRFGLPSFIGLRYSRAKRRNGFISFIGWVSIIGIAIGVWALITVLSVMNGFGNELRGRILDVASHVSIEGKGQWLDDWEENRSNVVEKLNNDAVAPYINGQGLAVMGEAVNGAIILGIDPELESKVSPLEDSMSVGKFTDLESGKFQIIIGEDLSRLLSANVGSKITIMAPQGKSTPAGLIPRMRRFEVVGIFKIGMYEYDSALAVVHIDDAARLFNTRGGVTGLRVKLDDVYTAPDVSAELGSHLGLHYFVSNWTYKHRNFFKALVIEKRMMSIMLFLIVAVAAINIISTLVMVVTDKQADIAILRTMGLPPKGVMAVFFTQGITSGVVGTLIGGLLGILTAVNFGSILSLLESLFGFSFFPPDVYLLSEFDADLRVSDILTIITGSLLISMFATLFPSWRASKVEPAAALRYE